MNVKSPKQQQGAVLFIAIALLLVITIVGISTVSISGIKTQVAGNSMFTMLTYQGAESALAKSLIGGVEKSMKRASELGQGNPYSIPENVFNSPSEAVSFSGAVTLTQEATVTSLGMGPCPITMVANGVGNCLLFETKAQARLDATGARAFHIEGRAADPASINN